MPTYVVDIETDGLVSTKIHVVSAGYQVDGEWKIMSTPDHDKIISLLTNEDNTLVGHNFKGFDVIELERVLDIKVTARVIDTLALAWYIYPTRKQGTFGLADFGEDYGIPKPKIDDWEGLSYEDYKHRCEEDVKINIKVWEDISNKLTGLYGSEEEADKFVKYLMFKMDCVAAQKVQKCKVDIDMVKHNMGLLESLREPKEEALIEAMPHGGVLKSRPKKMTKADSTLSALGQKWYDLLRELGLPTTTEEIYKPSNPHSTSQIKSWLFKLGWKPDLYKDGANEPVPQIRDSDRQLCKSVLDLADVEPAIKELDGLTVINHRLGVLKSFIDTVDDDGYTIASMNGFTNTLRLRHSRPIANLAGVTGGIKKAMDKGATKVEALANNLRDGQIIRECIVAPEGYELCGSDITSLEDNTKRHYMWDYDPEYVTDQMTEGYDPHLDLAIRAGALTEEEVEQHILYSTSDGEEGVSQKEVRSIYKMVNYSAIYGVGAPKLSESTGLTKREAKKLLEAYWDRNWSIKQLPKDVITKHVGEEMWLQNPVNEFWYSVRSEKDIFSTLNQGTGAFVFDCWLKFMMNEGVIPFLQYHDEKLSLVPLGQRDKWKRIVEESMVKVNEVLRLNVDITVDVQFGKTYADVH